MERKYYKIYIIFIIYDTSYIIFFYFDELFFIFRFHASKVAAKAVTLSIRQQFGRPWPTWGVIPKDHHDLFFQRFKVNYSSVTELVEWLKWILKLFFYMKL